ncbi:sugar phosphate isomerase/epimerase family protein [Galbibacter mesophilus]|uniref:sugar phosphate isomerase/epimerase family protein n=1 Tax=Galbibacter mesophilus TaxID=379069 RepID=UPI00191F8AAE|nr:sugar phosphate isomerase/epimerase family protein [Galbibacter mesophilus]MCM5662561.1 sugar phosphate isomerase/epimerase [Galbibacter mesophilus]
MKRRIFIKQSGQASLALSFLGLYACKDANSKKAETPLKETTFEPFFKFSLAQWSIHKMILEENTNPIDFAEMAKKWGFTGLEYVSQLYNKELEKRGNDNNAVLSLAEDLKKKSDEHGMHNQIMMVDLRGEENLLVSPKAALRKMAVENHKIWIDATAILGCHSMRINLFGTNDKEEWKEGAIESLTALSDYAAEKNVNVIVENHGYLSSNAALVAEVMEAVNKENCGTLPDFGNFCLRREGDALWDAPCVEEYDMYKGVKELMPYAKGVSAKSHDFDKQGNETTIDYYKMMKIVKDAGYTGYVGVEYEGSNLSEEKGILATKALLLDVAKKLDNPSAK